MGQGEYKNQPRQPEGQDPEVLKPVIPELERILREYEEKLASQGGRDLEIEKADAELAALEIDAKVAAAISELFEHIKLDVSFDTYLRHSNAVEHDQITQQQRNLEELQKAFLDLSKKYDPTNLDNKIAGELSRLRTEIESVSALRALAKITSHISSHRRAI